MTQEQALQYIHDHPEVYLQKAKAEGYICPICGSGSGPKGTGITSSKQAAHRFTCWRGCFTSADIPDIIAIKEGLQPGSWQALKRAYEVYGLTIDREDPSPTGHQQALSQPPAKKPEQQDYTAYYAECHARVGQTDYPQKRGLTSKTIDRFQLGYDPAFKTKEGDTFTTWEALIIPNGAGGFTARNTNPDAEPGNRYRNRGTKEPFNLQALEGDSPVFIVEGELDALSIIEVHGEAVALRGAGINNLLAEAKKAKQPLILSLDKDEAGREAETKLMEGLKAQGTPFLQADITGDYKDASAAYNGPGIVDFAKTIHSIQQSLKTEEEAAQEAEKDAYKAASAAGHMQGFLDAIAASRDSKPFSTGIITLDQVLDGGIYTGLYFIGGGTSSGKTTLMMQIMDSIASQGQDVLIFSLEMARHELMAKSISRLTLLQCFQDKINTSNAKTTRDILSGARHEEYNKTEKELFKAACRKYEEDIGGRLYILEGIGNIGVNEVRAAVEKHIRNTGNKPVVFIDYLQLLAPVNERYTDKQNMDKSVMELKRISRDFAIPVLAVSSLNRASYQNNIDLEAFKESGAIEYSSDVLLGLQYQGAGNKAFDKETAEKQRQRKMELKILKQRNAPKGQKLGFDFYSFANYFHETGPLDSTSGQGI